MIPHNLLIHKAVIREYVGKTPSGIKYKDVATLSCRYEACKKVVKTTKGEEFVQSGVVFFNPAPVLDTLPLDSLIVIGLKAYTVKEIEALSGLTAIDHYEVVVS